MDLPLLASDSMSEFSRAEQSHPRLFFKAEDSQIFPARVDSDSVMAEFARYVIEVADSVFPQPPLKRELEGRRLLGVSRQCLRRLMYLSMAYRLTGRDVYASRAESEMLAVAGFENWNPDHFLDVAEMTAGMAIGYDWCYDALEEVSRGKIRDAIIQLGLKTSVDEDMWWLSYPNNWNQVCHGGLVLGALSVFEDTPEISSKIISRAFRNVDNGLGMYAPDGAYPEGPGYWAYGTSYSVMMMSALESALGADFDLPRAPGFSRVG
ncbi:hypothetical protein SH580_16945 [Coraliomargarita algicola]|uniref:Heparinase II N-terminal domain-containing protein n=1 Tax=Coraliomargarita algicola TaxID=3092156 RepID=A0ABZ0RG18_9BACT|nr:hypothetical protein [Coraliomargarita sp. J2-16]WPJ95114.1 hypothetical protein SH580_16945 [Coraliomargarita sp. J2-16]